MFKKLLFLFVLFAAVGSVFADNNVTLEINGVIVQEGLVYVAVYSNEELDCNFFGVPKEPVGITNYNSRG